MLSEATAGGLSRGSSAGAGPSEQSGASRTTSSRRCLPGSRTGPPRPVSAADGRQSTDTGELVPPVHVTPPADRQVGERHHRDRPRAGDRGLTVAVDGTGDRRVVLPAEWVQGTRMDEVTPTCPTPGSAPSTAPRAARGKPSTCSAHQPQRLPGLRRPVPVPPAHPHLEHHPGHRPRPRRPPADAHPDEHVLAALARTPDPRLAAVTDPHPPTAVSRAQIARAPPRPQQRAATGPATSAGPRDTLKAERKQTEASLHLAEPNASETSSAPGRPPIPWAGRTAPA